MALVIPTSIVNAIKEVLVQKLSVPAVHKTADGRSELKIQDNRIVIIVNNKDDNSDQAIDQKFAVIRMNAEDVNNLYDALVRCYVHGEYEPYHQSIVALSIGQSIEVARLESKVHISILLKDCGTVYFELPVID